MSTSVRISTFNTRWLLFKRAQYFSAAKYVIELANWAVITINFIVYQRLSKSSIIRTYTLTECNAGAHTGSYCWRSFSFQFNEFSTREYALRWNCVFVVLHFNALHSLHGQLFHCKYGKWEIWYLNDSWNRYTVVSVRYMLSTWSRTCMKRLYFSFIHEKKAFLLKWMAFSWTVNTCHGCTHWWGSKGAQQQYIVIVCRLFFVRLRFLCMLETFQNRVTWFDVH